jgi:hypothetical protein
MMASARLAAMTSPPASVATREQRGIFEVKRMTLRRVVFA